MSATSSAMPVELTIIYDDGCELCRRCRAWIEGQTPLIPISFTPASSPSIRAWADEWLPVGEELVVIGHIDSGSDGASGEQVIWVGADAFVTCLWALRDYRKLSKWLQRAGLRSVARQVVHGLTVGRGPISGMLATPPPPPGSCSAGVCAVGSELAHSEHG